MLNIDFYMSFVYDFYITLYDLLYNYIYSNPITRQKKKIFEKKTLPFCSIS